MLGFIISINKDEKKVGLEYGITTLNLSRIKTNEKDTCSLHVSGYDSQKELSKKWIDQSIKEGDKIIIEVKQINSYSTPESSKKLDTKDAILKGKLRAYEKIKKELEEEGLI